VVKYLSYPLTWKKIPKYPFERGFIEILNKMVSIKKLKWMPALFAVCLIPPSWYFILNFLVEGFWLEGCIFLDHFLFVQNRHTTHLLPYASAMPLDRRVPSEHRVIVRALNESHGGAFFVAAAVEIIVAKAVTGSTEWKSFRSTREPPEELCAEHGSQQEWIIEAETYCPQKNEFFS